MMIKKPLAIFLTISLLLVAACETRSTPEKALASYLDALLRNDWASVYSALSEKDREVRSLSELIDQWDQPYAYAIGSRSSYKIVEIKQDTQTAQATIEWSRPDLGAIWDDYYELSKKELSRRELSDAFNELILQQFGDNPIPRTTHTEKLSLRLEDNGWRVFVDFKSIDKAEELFDDAEELREAEEWQASVAKFDEVLTLQPEHSLAKFYRDMAAKSLAAWEAKQAYIESIEIYDIKAKYFESMSNGRLPGVDFKLRNNGDRTLTQVEVTFYFEDSAGKVIAEEDYHPVLVTEYGLNDDKPLKPNYIWQMERGKFYVAKSVPDEWEVGRVTAIITDIEFQKDTP